MHPEIDVLVIGAGLSGLVAAYRILKKDSSIRLIIAEASGHIGGQILCSGSGELGAKWFNGSQYHLLDLCKELEINVLPKRNVHGERLWDIELGITSFAAKYELKKFFAKIDLICKMYPAHSNYLRSSSVSMEKYICDSLIFPSARNVVRMLVRTTSGVDASNINFVEYMTLCNGTLGITNQFECLTGTGDQYTVVPNLTILIDALEGYINTNKIVTDSKVKEIMQFQNGVNVYTENGHHFFCTAIIMAIPWQNVLEIKFVPELSAKFHQKKIPNQLLTGFTATYKEPWWSKRGLSGSLLKFYPSMICHETAPKTISGVAYIDGKYKGNIKEDILLALQREFGEAMSKPEQWDHVTWVQSQILQLPQTSPWNRIVWASTNSSILYRGYLNGAVESGIRAAVSVLLSLRPQLLRWQDYAEAQPSNYYQKRFTLLGYLGTFFSLYNFAYYSITLLTLFGSIKLLKHLLETNQYNIKAFNVSYLSGSISKMIKINNLGLYLP